MTIDRDLAASTSAPNDTLDALRQCGGSPTIYQARYEAILAAIGLVAFGTATLIYRHRRRREALSA